MRDMQSTINIIKTIYGMPFRGKKGGRYSLTRNQLKQILDVPRLHPRYISQLQDSLQRRGLVLIDLDFAFSIVPIVPFKNQRKPPQDILNQLTGRLPDDEGLSDIHAAMETEEE